MKTNLIGISGRINSGKDTVGKILQYLNCSPSSVDEIDHMMKFITDDKYKSNLDIASNYQIKKFAGKLKDIACLLLGCTRQQLEDRGFKETELGEKWNHLKPRKILQLLGTEAGREIIHPNIWVNALFADYVCDDCGQKECPTDEEDTGQMIHYSFPNWIITDVRFPNEAQAIKDRGGIVIRVNRDYQNPLMPNVAIPEHPSETALDNHNFDYVIDNSSSISDLIDKVKQLKL